MFLFRCLAWVIGTCSLRAHASRLEDAEEQAALIGALDSAVAAEVAAANASAASVSQWSPEVFDSAVDRSWDDAMVMQTVRRTFSETLLNRQVPGGTKMKVGFLFMAKDHIDQHALWQQFFQSAEPDQFSLFIHQYAPNSEKAAQARNLWSLFNATFIPTVKTGWGQLAGVEYALFWEALRDPAVGQFVLLSEGHVPFKSFGYVYDYLTRKGDESKICFNKPESKLNLMVNELTKSCHYRDSLQHVEVETSIGGKKELLPGRVRKHHQWLVLARTHAVDVVENGEEALRRHLKVLARAQLPAPGSDPAMLGANDETFVATALLLASEKRGSAQRDSLAELAQSGVRSECTSFVYWRHCFRGTALGAENGWNMSIARELRIMSQAAMKVSMSDWNDARKSPAKYLNDSPRDFGKSDSHLSETYLRALVGAGFLFGRKFGRDERGQLASTLEDVLPPLWTAWDAHLGQRTAEKLARESDAWPVLDVGDATAWKTAKERIADHGPLWLDQGSRGAESDNSSDSKTILERIKKHGQAWLPF
eukprot:TRINITY_DN88607_c0_g1_i1.p1 TRINITY_DN88607_c0_g1~~TRINITY_DN88607_c0_g1_i1.p1  ORF type:complete len:537 (+),score=95.73 TRINITY_DN88607_c0_g1_i1:96-1706(+)